MTLERITSVGHSGSGMEDELSIPSAVAPEGLEYWVGYSELRF